jgi:iron complex outermembrane receptor protein
MGLRKFVVSVVSSLLFTTPLAALAGDGGLAGRAVAEGGEPAAGCEIRVAGTTRRATADGEGRFAFEALPAGSYLIEATSPRFGRGVAAVEVVEGEIAEVEIALDREIHGEELLVTASPEAASAEDLVRPASVLAGDELLAALEPTLGETLAGEPGVHSTYFGPGASRPIIRGLGGDRIRVLDAGLGVGDVSTTSPDHAVALESMAAERIEIVRGPATLLYGSSAVGGVVNVFDGSIPDYLPEEPVSGEVTLRAASAADERSGAASLTGAAGSFAWHAGYSRRETDDHEIPGRAESEPELEEEHGGEEEEAPRGVLPNSALEAENASAGLSWIGDDGFLGVSVSGFETIYGVPGHAHGHEGEEGEGVEEEEEAPVRIDLEQRRVDLRGEIARDLGPLRGLKVRLGTADYEHRELEGSEVGTHFLSDSWEGRIEARHRAFGAVTGAWGFQAGRREFEAIGEEAFVPANDSDSWALFAFEEVAAGAATWQLGARYESLDVEVAGSGLPDRSFSGVSGSLGVTWKASDVVSASASLSRSVTLPNPEALYSNGAHAATRTFEVGDPTLGEETSLGLDVGAHVELGRVHLEAALFANRVDGFIYEAFTDEVEDGLQVVRFRQDDAELTGGEVEAHVELVHGEDRHLELDLSTDWVRAELVDSGAALPRIPPLRYGAGLSWRQGAWSARAGVRRFERQDRVAPFERETGGYTLVEASVGWRFFLGATVHDLLLSGTNLTDEEARVHTSFLKDQAPLPGRDLRLSWRLAF